jgi:F-type H+-transporting ATPase subunit epsilon
MKTFTLEMNSATQQDRVEAVVSFVGEDASGQFGLLAGHARMTTVLNYGLARYRRADDGWTYLALPGAVLHFRDDGLHLTARRYFQDTDFERISAALNTQLRIEERQLESLKENLGRLEREMFRKLWELERQ